MPRPTIYSPKRLQGFQNSYRARLGGLEVKVAVVSVSATGEVIAPRVWSPVMFVAKPYQHIDVLSAWLQLHNR